MNKNILCTYFISSLIYSVLVFLHNIWVWFIRMCKKIGNNEDKQIYLTRYFYYQQLQCTVQDKFCTNRINYH